MKLRVLGCAGSEAPNRRPPGFLLDGSLLLDAGSIGSILTQNEQAEISHILLTHAHLDHIRGIPHLADNLVIAGKMQPVTIAGSTITLGALRQHLLNDIIWPDFSRIPSREAPILRFEPIEANQTFNFGPYAVTAFHVNHSVPTLAYRIERDGLSLVYTGDMGPTAPLWSAIGTPSAMIVEISFPNDMEQFALTTGHLTPKLLASELARMPQLPSRILINHIKPYYETIIRAEVAALGIRELAILRDGQTIRIGGD